MLVVCKGASHFLDSVAAQTIGRTSPLESLENESTVMTIECTRGRQRTRRTAHATGIAPESDRGCLTLPYAGHARHSRWDALVKIEPLVRAALEALQLKPIRKALHYEATTVVSKKSVDVYRSRHVTFLSYGVSDTYEEESATTVIVIESTHAHVLFFFFAFISLLASLLRRFHARLFSPL